MQVMFMEHWLILPLRMHCLSRYEALELESSENTQIKSKTIAHLLKFHTRAGQIRMFMREFVRSRVTQFVP